MRRKGNIPGNVHALSLIANGGRLDGDLHFHSIEFLHLVLRRELLRHLVGEQRREVAFVRERAPDGLECLLVIGCDEMVMVA